MKPENSRGIYKEIALQINIETAVNIHSLLKGQQIEFPKKLYSSSYIRLCIKTEFNGNNAHELARKYSISERRIRQILKETLNKISYEKLIVKIRIANQTFTAFLSNKRLILAYNNPKI